MRGLARFALLLASLSVGGAASAQSPVDAGPTPPTAYVGAGVSLDDALSPLAVAAERDLAAGRASLAAGRAQVLLDLLGASSSLRFRADGVRLVAAQTLAGAAPEAIAVDVLLLPLIEQAELDLSRGDRALALARLEVVSARVTEGALSIRAAGLRMVAQQPATPPPSTVTAPPAPAALRVSPPPPVAGGGALGAPGALPQAPVGAGYAYVGPGGSAPPQELAEEAPPTTPVDPTRRGNGELTELYISAGLLGGYTGFFLPFAAGLEATSGGSGSGANLVYSLSILAGGGLFALGVAGLDSGAGMRTGIAPAMSTGIRYGLLTGFLMWGALDPVLDPASGRFDPLTGRMISTGRLGLAQRTALPFGFGLGGLLLGAALGYGLEPSTDQVRFVETGGLWGMSLGLLIAVGAAQSSEAGFALTVGGLGAGLLTNALVAGSGVRISARRAWFMTLGLAIGAGGGAIIPAIASSASGGFSRDVFGTITVVTSIAGLVGAYFLTEGMDAPRPGTRPEAGPDVRLSVSPMDDGGLATASGTF